MYTDIAYIFCKMSFIFHRTYLYHLLSVFIWNQCTWEFCCKYILFPKVRLGSVIYTPKLSINGSEDCVPSLFPQEFLKNTTCWSLRKGNIPMKHFVVGVLFAPCDVSVNSSLSLCAGITRTSLAVIRSLPPSRSCARAMITLRLRGKTASPN